MEGALVLKIRFSKFMLSAWEQELQVLQVQVR